MAVVIRLQRMGTRNKPFFRMVVAESRRARDGAFIDNVGYYDPVPDPDVISIDRARMQDWVGKGAKPSVAVRRLLARFDRRQSGAAEPAPRRSRDKSNVVEAAPESPQAESIPPDAAGEAPAEG